ncbi:MAG: holo-ACP synthase [Rickettsiaceae bacterium]|nr:holo-ACP synthase [Rickettsiaceae bacterium]
MDIIGIGTDIVNIDRIRKIYSRFGKSFLEKNFHTQEIDYFNNLISVDKIPYLAKRFAGKEAVSKALGTGIGEVAFKDIAILNNKLGAPYVLIDTPRINYSKNIKINISLSDEAPFAVAFVVISG